MPVRTYQVAPSARLLEDELFSALYTAFQQMAALCDTGADIVSCRRFYIIIIIYYKTNTRISQGVLTDFIDFLQIKQRKAREAHLSCCFLLQFSRFSALLPLIFLVFFYFLL